MTDRVLKRLWSLVGVAVTAGGLLSILTSKTVKVWVRGHSYWVFIALILAVAGVFVAVDVARSIERRKPTEHDRKTIARLLEILPEDKGVIIWLKEAYVTKYALIKDLDIFDEALKQMTRNVVGLDDNKANEAYQQLSGAIDIFLDLVNGNLFADSSGRRMVTSSDWEQDWLNKLRADLVQARNDLVAAYDRLIEICHAKHIY